MGFQVPGFRCQRTEAERKEDEKLRSEEVKKMKIR